MVSGGKRRSLVADVPQRDNDELGILCSILDVVSNDGDVAEVECGINFVHEIEGRRFEDVEGKHECQ